MSRPHQRDHEDPTGTIPDTRGRASSTNTQPHVRAQVGRPTKAAPGSGGGSAVFAANSENLSALTDEELTVHCTDLTTRERALNVEVTAALEECQRRHAARVGATAPRVEARAS